MTESGRDFEKFYFAKVGLGEGCGCAERVIDMHEADRKAASWVSKPVGRPKSLGHRWRLALNALGLTRRD